MTPFEIKFLIHYYVGSPGDAPELTGALIGPNVARDFVRDGLLAPGRPEDTRRFYKTDKLDAYMTMLQATPIPESAFIDPRTGKPVSDSPRQALISKLAGKGITDPERYLPR